MACQSVYLNYTYYINILEDAYTACTQLHHPYDAKRTARSEAKTVAAPIEQLDLLLSIIAVLTKAMSDRLARGSDRYGMSIGGSRASL